MDHALNSDILYTTKVGVKYNIPFDYEFLTNTLSVSASAEASSNFTDAKFLKGKFFARYTESIGNI